MIKQRERRKFRFAVRQAEDLHDLLEEAHEQYLSFLDEGGHPDDALQKVGEWLVTAVRRRIHPGQFEFTIQNLLSDLQEHGRRQRYFIDGYLLFRLFRSSVRRPHRADLASRLMSLALIDRCESTSSYDPLRWHFLTEYRKIGQQWAREPDERTFVASIPAEKGRMLASLPDPDSVKAALELGRTSLDELESLYRADVDLWWPDLTQALDNCARIWRNYKALPDSSEVQLTLLEETVRLAEDALDESKRELSSKLTTPDREALHRNLWLSWANARFDLLEARGNTSELSTHCNDVLEEFDDFVDPGASVPFPIKLRFLRHAGADTVDFEWKSRCRSLIDLATELYDEARPLEAEEAFRVSVVLDVMTQRLDGGDSCPDFFPWRELSCVMSHLHTPTTASLVARELVCSEANFLEELRTYAETPNKLSTYLEQGKSACDDRLDHPHASGPSRRVFAARKRSLSLCQLGLETESTPPERLQHWEEAGSGAYRSDLHFWSQGPVEFERSTNGRTISEPWWRACLHTARLSLDGADFAELFWEVGHLYPGFLGSPEAIRQRWGRNLVTLELEQDGESSGGPREQTPEGARTRFHSILDDREPEWSLPATETDSDRASASVDELEKWLTDSPETAVFVATQSGGELFWADEAGDVHNEKLTNRMKDEWHRTWADALDQMVDQHSRFDYGQNIEIPDDGLPTGEPPKSPGTIGESGFEPQSSDDATALGFGEALSEVFEYGSRLADAITDIADQHDVENLVVLPRQRSHHVPWEYLRSEDGRLADHLNVVRLPTLAAAPPDQRPNRDETLTCVPLEDSEDPMAFGSHALEPFGSVEGAISRDRFEHRAMESDVVRLFTHARFDVVPMTSDLCLGMDTSSPDGRNRSNGGGHLGWHRAGEVKCLDLRGCRRVELWGCESQLSMDSLGALFGGDEPTSLASAFLLAGARRVVGALWKKPVAPTALIAAGYANRVREVGDVWEDARALSECIRAYRSAVREDGPVAQAMLEFTERRAPDVDSPRALRKSALATGWQKAFEILAGEPAEPPETTSIRNYLGGFASESVEERELRNIRDDPEQAVRNWLQLSRSPLAWAGWIITARDRSCL
jgi:hypothetical protein